MTPVVLLWACREEEGWVLCGEQEGTRGTFEVFSAGPSVPCPPGEKH